MVVSPIGRMMHYIDSVVNRCQSLQQLLLSAAGRTKNKMVVREWGGGFLSAPPGGGMVNRCGSLLQLPLLGGGGNKNKMASCEGGKTKWPPIELILNWGRP